MTTGERRTTDEVAAALRTAAEEAHRRKHAVVRGSHLTVALLAGEPMKKRVRLLGWDADHLFEHAESALRAEPSSAAYRDGVVPTMCPSVTTALRRGRLLPWSVVGAEDLVDALSAAPDLRGAYRPYVLGTDDAEAAVAAATMRALERGARTADLVDGLAAVLDSDPMLGERIAAAGLDLASLGAVRGGSFVGVAALAAETLRQSGHRSVTRAVLVAHALRLLGTRAEIDAAVLGEAIAAVVHGADDAVDPGLADDDDADLVLLDDPITTMDEVVGILVGVLGWTDEQALEGMMAVHRQGAAVLEQTTAADARGLADAIMEAARRHAFPLRATVRRHAGESRSG